ncbi:MAG TPA: DUF5615 family PIN-like protein, partial [Blastocatellia bacterium]|nr:DUF5615 family PIN-like protein [Blastocatellia bacterium]
MKIKLDENLPVLLASMLATLGHDVDTVPAEGLAGSTYPAVWRASQDAGRFFVSKLSSTASSSTSTACVGWISTNPGPEWNDSNNEDISG